MDKEKASGILVFAEERKGDVHNVAYELLNKAQELKEDLDCEVASAVLSSQKLDYSELIYRGADKVYCIEDEKFASPEENYYKKNLLKITNAFNPEILLLGATGFGRSLAPRLAIALETGLTADCVDLQIDEESNKLIQIRPAFSGNILAHIKTEGLPQMATIRYKEFTEAPRDTSRSGEIIKLEPTEGEIEVGIEKIEERAKDITEAKIIIAGGQGLKQPQDLDILQDLADKLGGMVGASRDIVDEGYISHAHQVGYSGARVKPKIYIACGISGATQHIVGMKEADIIIAINKDPSAPIFNVADYGIVGDLYEVVPDLIAKIEDCM